MYARLLSMALAPLALLLLLVCVPGSFSWSKYDFGYSECTYNSYYTKCFGDGYQLHQKRRGLTQFPHLKNAEECLVLEDNEIRSFPQDLRQYSSLLALNVAKNRITALPDNLDVLNKLKVLDLSENGLSELSSTTRFPVSLEALILKGNTLRSLPVGLNIPGLFVLDLAGNRFSNVPKEFCVSKQLIRVDFTQNSQIGDISDYVDVLNECKNVNEISFCFFTDRDYIKCDCNTLGIVMLEKPAFQLGTPLPNQFMTCSSASQLHNTSSAHLFDLGIDVVRNACPTETFNNQDADLAHGGTSTRPMNGASSVGLEGCITTTNSILVLLLVVAFRMF